MFRFLLQLKSYVRNRAYPEGSIAEGYLANECITFCSRYFDLIETSFNQTMRNEEPTHTNEEERSFSYNVGRPLGRKKHKGFNVSKRKRISCIVLDKKSWIQAHRHVLFNSEEVTPFLK